MQLSLLSLTFNATPLLNVFWVNQTKRSESFMSITKRETITQQEGRIDKERQSEWGERNVAGSKSQAELDCQLLSPKKKKWTRCWLHL